MKPRALAGLVALAVVLLAVPRVAHADEPFLKKGDRVVFFGDSITEQKLYTRYVQQYVYARHPDLEVRFFNAGWGGDSAPGARARLERDVLSLQPTVVTLAFGMNDGGYRPPDAAVLAKYRENLEAIVETLTAKGIRVVVCSPGCVDADRSEALAKARYDATLEGLVEAGRGIAKKAKCRFVDFRAPMLAYQTARKRLDPAFTMIPDGVHPDESGHLVMARALLAGLDVDVMAPLGRIDVASGKGDGLRVVENGPTGTVLETVGPVGTPFWFADGTARAARESGLLDELAGQKLTVTGLAGPDYDVAIDDVDVGHWSGASLAKGVTVPGTWSVEARRLHDVLQAKEALAFVAWRQVRLPLDGAAGLSTTVEALTAADDAFDRTARANAAPRPKAKLSIAPAPAGENLAAGRPYVSSDPNTFGWSQGGLTDGSWEATSAHCFATGDARELPKQVTVDLGKGPRISSVRLGVPEFGSTKTVTLSSSLDGKSWKDLGSVVFEPRRAQRRTLRFPAVNARYVRLTYPDRQDVQVGYPVEFAFTTELEVYGDR